MRRREGEHGRAGLPALPGEGRRDSSGVAGGQLVPGVRGSGRCGPGGAAGVLELGVDALRFGELIFEDDDAAGSVQRGGVADELVGPGSEAELVAGVAAVPPAGALRCDQPGRVQAAEESWRDAQDFRGTAHAVGGVVVVIELLIGGMAVRPAGAARGRVMRPSGNATGVPVPEGTGTR